MHVFHYHPVSGEYLGTSVADESPREPGVFLIPGFATSIAPPDAVERHARVFIDGAWSQVVDRRGETWWDDKGMPVYIEALGDPSDAGLTDIEPVPEPEPEQEPPTLDEVKAFLTTAIDGNAEAARLQFITGGAGQALTYQQKAAEAAACLADPEPTPEKYTLLSAEIGITADTLLDVAAVVSGAYGMWVMVGAQIEALRLAAKKAVAAAESVEAAEAAADVQWPTPPS